MDDSDYHFLQIATLVLPSIVAIGQMIYIHTQAYYSRKGQNLADKEDIKEITRSVESVKSDFAREYAKLNLDLDILRDKSGKIYTEAQQAIIFFQKDIDNLINSTIELRFTGLSQKNFKEFELKVNTLETLKNKSRSSFNLIMMLVSDKDCLSLASTLLSEINIVLDDFFLTFYEIKDTSDSINNYNDYYEVYCDQGLEHDVAQWIEQLENKFYKEVEDKSKQLSNIQRGLLTTLQPHQLKFINRAKKFLSQV